MDPDLVPAALILAGALLACIGIAALFGVAWAVVALGVVLIVCGLLLVT